VKSAAQTQTVFDQSHYLQLIDARGATIRELVTKLKPVLGLSTALDAGCGLGFFSQTLQECGLKVHAFDGRDENITEGRRRFPQVMFETGDIQDANITRLGKFDMVLCFGLLYHLESTLLAIRHLHALTEKVLLLESMCIPEEEPRMLLREEPSVEDQSLTDVAFYPSEGCFAKMLYRAGFSHVYRVAKMPEHDDFRDTAEHRRRRTVLIAAPKEIQWSGLIYYPEPRDNKDPWSKNPEGRNALPRRVKNFFKKPAQAKYIAVARRMRRILPNLPIPMRLPFGSKWIAKNSALDHELMANGFESAEMRFVQNYLKPGMTVLDVGAHHGLYTLLASKCVGPQGKVIAFEPSPRERERLQSHLRMNRSENVRVEAVALGSETGSGKLFLVDGAEDWCNSLRPPVVKEKTTTVAVEVRCLDEVLAALGTKRVDFLKLDVEGAELDVLKGAAKLLNGDSRPVVLAEVYDIRTEPWGYAAREIVKFLSQAKFEWFALDESGELKAISAVLDKYDANLVALPAERANSILAELAGKEGALCRSSG
jgi:FkbM family methyltransferase